MAGTYASDRRALQQLALNVHVKQSHRLTISHKTSYSKYELYIIYISIKISALEIGSNEFPITHQTAFPNTFSTLTSFLYPAMHQARISNVRTLGEKTSHIKLIFVKYIVNF